MNTGGFYWTIPQLLIWGAMSGAASMLVYRLVSPQKAIRRAKEAAANARAVLGGYDGEAAGLLPLAGRALGQAFRHMGLVIGPTLLAAIPVVLTILCFRDLPVCDYIPWGPAWMRGWMTPFLLATTVAALVLKRILRVT